MVKLTPTGRRLMKKLFPKFNAEERFVVANIKPKDRADAADMLRAICLAVKTD
jgi:Mn-dependent DtxR family transcriptional regulator